MTKKTARKFFVVIYTIFLCIISIALTLAIIATTEDNDSMVDFAMGYGNTRKMDETIAMSFDKFFAFGTLSAGDLHNLSLLSEEDQLQLRNSRNGCNNFDYYLGIIDNRDVVIVVNPINANTLTFDSNLDYKYAEIILEFENQSGVILTDEFLTTSCYDNELHRESGGIALCLRYERGDLFNGERPYFKAKINGKVYVIDK